MFPTSRTPLSPRRGEGGRGERGPSREEQARALGRARRRRFLAETALSLLLSLFAWYSGLAPALAHALGLAAEPSAPGLWLVGGGTVSAWLAAALLVAVLLLAYRLALLPLEYLAGYRVYWRLTTEPQWTHSRWVGDVDAHILRNLVIDNYFFGVAAVAKDGSESPVVFPGAAGSFGGY